jgi:hypothetical protein
MSESRDFGRMALELREALDQHSREELADLLTHILRTYVIEANASINLDTGPQPGLGELRGLSFAQLVLRLQMSLPHDELRKLQVSGSRVWVEEGGREMNLTAWEEEAAELPPDEEVISPPRSGRRAAPEPESESEPDPWDAGPSRREGPPRVERVEASPSPWSPPPAVTREAAPGVPAPRRDAPSPGVRVEEVGPVARPAAGLRGQQPNTSPRLPGEEARPGRRRPSWSDDPTSDEVPAPRGKGEAEVGDVSERFSMLELD